MVGIMLLHRRAVRDLDWTHYIGEVIAVQKVANTTGEGAGGIATGCLEFVLELNGQIELFFRSYREIHIALPKAGYVMMGFKG